MRNQKKERTKLPAPLYRVWKHFDQWRRSHRPRARFHEGLWSEAVAVAREYGHNRTAQALGLDYYSLKKRLTVASTASSRGYKNSPSFVELIPPAQPECIIEIEDGEGGKMRISLKGGEIPDLVSLSRSFRRGGA